MFRKSERILMLIMIRKLTNVKNNINNPEETTYMSIEVKQICNLSKLSHLISQYENDLASMKSTYDCLKGRQKQMKNVLKKIQTKALKNQNKPKSIRKPCGFARPSFVSSDMCDFLKVEHGSLVSRTEVTKSLIHYIKCHNLQNESNKRQIVPDETLYKLFGEESRKLDLTYFTMQKFVNQHFPKAVAAPQVV